MGLKSHHVGHFDQEVHLITCALRHTGVQKQPSVSQKSQTGIIKCSHICINPNECVADHKRTAVTHRVSCSSFTCLVLWDISRFSVCRGSHQCYCDVVSCEKCIWWQLRVCVCFILHAHECSEALFVIWHLRGCIVCFWTSACGLCVIFKLTNEISAVFWCLVWPFAHTSRRNLGVHLHK